MLQPFSSDGELFSVSKTLNRQVQSYLAAEFYGRQDTVDELGCHGAVTWSLN